MMTWSDPVPKASPNAILLQNSTVAQANGKTPAKKTQKSEFCRNFTVLTSVASAIRLSLRAEEEPATRDRDFVEPFSLVSRAWCLGNDGAQILGTVDATCDGPTWNAFVAPARKAEATSIEIFGKAVILVLSAYGNFKFYVNFILQFQQQEFFKMHLCRRSKRHSSKQLSAKIV
jgi:hypothetical protein